MGLFGKKKSEKQPQGKRESRRAVAKSEKQPVPAKQVKARKKKKKDMTLVERMMLDESVAAASLDTLHSLVDSKKSAVRETDDGLLIIAITNDMLEATGLSPSGEEFGSFAEALRSESVESMALVNDLNDGVIGIIPSHETLLALDEFSFVHDLSFPWALVPFDLSDEDRLTLMDTTVDVARLLELAEDQSEQFEIDGTSVVAVQAEYDDSSEDDDMDIPLDDDGGSGMHAYDEPLDMEPYDESEPYGVEGDEYLDGSDNMPAYEGDDSSDALPDDDLQDEDYYGYGYDSTDELSLDDDSLDDEGLDNTEEGLSAEETAEVVEHTASHTFNNTELDLQVDLRKFDDYFNSTAIEIAQFDTSIDESDQGELQRAVFRMRQDANTELQRFRQDSLRALRNRYVSSLYTIHNKLIESLDHKDDNTTYGQRYAEIQHTYDDKIEDLDRMIVDEVAALNAEYNERRDDFAENARREALSTYDSRYRDGQNRKVDAVKDNLMDDFKTRRDVELGEMYSDRRTVAKRLYDKALAALLQQLQVEYAPIVQRELEMYDAFRKNMEAYLRKHFADEVLRAKAEAARLEQSHVADRVRQEYEQMLLTKSRQIEEMNDAHRDELKVMEQSLKEQMASVSADFERRIEREQQDNKNMRSMVQDAQQQTGVVEKQVEEKYRQQVEFLKNSLGTKDAELDYAKAQNNKASRTMMIIIAAVGFVTLAVGIILGFMYGVNSTTSQIAPGILQDTPLSYMLNMDKPVYDTLINEVVGKDVT